MIASYKDQTEISEIAQNVVSVSRIHELDANHEIRNAEKENELCFEAVL